MTDDRLAAAALAALGAASALPIPLAQLDFAGVINVFGIDAGDTPRALLVTVGIAGFSTIGVLALAFAGVVLTLTGSGRARAVLTAAALAGLATAMPLWVPAAVAIGAAAFVLAPSARTETGAVGPA